MDDFDKVTSSLEAQIHRIEKYQCCWFPGYENVTKAMRDALKLLKEYKAIKESISDGIHETAKMFRRTAGDNKIPLKW